MVPLLFVSLPAALPTIDVTSALHAAETQRHTVVDGETVFDIAQRYGTTVSAIAAANGLSDPSLILPGAVLSIPSGTSGTTATAPTTSGSTYTVGAGDTLSGIAAATGSSVSAIAATNGITTYDFIHVGQSLTIPGAGTTPKRPASTTGSYTVQTGSTVAAIAKASGISPSSFLQIGQRLTIPTRTDRGDSGSTTSGTTTTTGAAPGSSEWADTMPSRSEIRDLISATASAYGVDPRLALAIGWQESGWQQGVTSSVGAVGAMQVMPQSGEWAGSLIGRTLNLRDAHDNVTAGVVIIRQLTAMAKDRDEVIAAYYRGLGSVQERGWYSDTRQYVANVNYFMTRV
jgi:LysM repeat protein